MVFCFAGLLFRFAGLLFALFSISKQGRRDIVYSKVLLVTSQKSLRTTVYYIVLLYIVHTAESYKVDYYTHDLYVAWKIIHSVIYLSTIVFYVNIV